MTTLLVVDDEPDMRLFLRLALESRGYEVIEAGDGRSALHAVDAERPDCMLLDLRMEGVDGWGVLEQLGAGGHLGQLPVVVQSAHARGETERAAIAAGARAFLRKPFSIDGLLQTVAEVLEGS